jgi:predicted transcriptional regulator
MSHPNRLPILIALEARPRTAKELVDELGLKPDPVRHAIKQLVTANLIEVVAEQRTGTKNLVGLVYGTRLTGWAAILSAVHRVAANAPC